MPSRRPDPSLILDFVNSYQKSAVIRAAVDLDVFTAIGEGATDVPSLAARCQASERGIRILCAGLTAHGFLIKTNSRYSLTLDSATFLDRRANDYMGGVVSFLQHEMQQRYFWELTDTIRRGTIPADREEIFGAEHPIWVEFARSMQPLMRPSAEFLAGVAIEAGGDRLRVLDIAAGHGLFGIAVAKAHPKAEITAQDWPGVLTVAEENAAKAGVASRHRLLPGSAFDVDFSGPYDCVLVTNFFHHFDPPTCVQLMRKIREALEPGGTVLTLDFIPNEDRVTPPETATFALTMLANTAAGEAYVFSQYDAMLTEAGFHGAHLLEPPFGWQRVVVARR